jgi:hypothetical protein
MLLELSLNTCPVLLQASGADRIHAAVAGATDAGHAVSMPTSDALLDAAAGPALLPLSA